MEGYDEVESINEKSTEKIDLSEFELIPSTAFKRQGAPAVKITCNSILFSPSCIKYIPNTESIVLLANKTKKILRIIGTESAMKINPNMVNSGIIWINKTGTEYKPVKLPLIISALFHDLSIARGMAYRVEGLPYEMEYGMVIDFDMNNLTEVPKRNRNNTEESGKPDLSVIIPG